jgi:LuxR family maltose regulon positive regulatory protein
MQRLNITPQCKLTLLIAPPGFGKTTLVGAWIRDGALPAAWLSLDPGDNDPLRFLSYLIAALQTMWSAFAPDVLTWLEAPRLSPQDPQAPIEAAPIEPALMDRALTALINEVQAIPEPFILVLDDYNVIESQQIHDAISFLVEHAPAHMHLVITSRSTPPLPLSRLRARGLLNELREAELRFTAEEAALFLNQAMALGLAAEDVKALEDRTEGWIAGLQLAALALQPLVAHPTAPVGPERSDVRSFIRAFAGTHRYILDYLSDEVLTRQPEHIQQFLLKTSVLERMSAGLCDAVTGGHDGQATLEMLERKHLFVVPLDGERRWYRYHSLFADLLHHRLERALPAEVPQLHLRACEWYADNDQIYEAMGHALAAQDCERAVQLLEAAGPIMAMRGEAATLLRWLDQLRDRDVRSRARLSLTYAWTLFVTSNMDAIEPRVQEALQALEAAPGAQPGQPVGTSAETGRFLAEAAGLRAFIAIYRGEPRRAIDLCTAALPWTAERSLARCGVSSILGDAYFGSDQLVSAQRYYQQALEESLVTGNPVLTKVLVLDLARLNVAQGKLHEAARIFQEVLDWGCDWQVPLYPVGQAYGGLGDVFREWNQPAAAESHLAAGLEHCLRGGYARYAIAGALSLAHLKAAQGSAAAVLDLLDRADALARGTGVAGFISRVAAWRARLWLMPGVRNLAPATQWLRSCGLGPEDQPRYAAEVEYFTLARAFLAMNRERPDPARLYSVRALLTRLLQAAEKSGRTRSVIECLVLLAQSWQAAGEAVKALNSLTLALALAEPEKYVRIFIDEGAPMADLLRLTIQREILPEYSGRLLQALEGAAGVQPLQGSGAAAGNAPLLVESLSAREIEVLRLLVTGLSNAEIADQLIVTRATVKAHVRSIFRKLDVANRVQAAARARELGLLSDQGLRSSAGTHP